MMKKKVRIFRRSSPMRKKIFTIIVVIVFILCAYLELCHLTRQGFSMKGRVAYTSGNILVYIGKPQYPKSSSMGVTSGDVLDTGKTKRTVISFEDKMTLRLAESTRIEFMRTSQRLCRLSDIKKGKWGGFFKPHVEIRLVTGCMWVDKSEHASLIAGTEDAYIFPRNSVIELSTKSGKYTSISVYRGQAKVALSTTPRSRVRVHPGQKCVIKNNKFQTFGSLKYDQNNEWLNWNMALSYIAPPSLVASTKDTAYHFPDEYHATDAKRQYTDTSGNKAGREGVNRTAKDTGNKKVSQTAKETRNNEITQTGQDNPYSFENWVKEKLRGSDSPYPKYTPINEKIGEITFSKFPQADDQDEDDAGSDSGKIPSSPPSGDKGKSDNKGVSSGKRSSDNSKDWFPFLRDEDEYEDEE